MVFLVALPLCLGIAIASGAPPLAGLLSGIIGGIVVGIMSGSQFSVSGPAAGLTAIIYNALEILPSYSSFLTAVMLAGVLQIIMGLAKLGKIKRFFPSSVIHGMLGAIGLLLILKQIPIALGYNAQDASNLIWVELNNSLFHDVFNSLANPKRGVLIISSVSLMIIIYLSIPAFEKYNVLKYTPPALIAVIVGTFISLWFVYSNSSYAISKNALVQMPDIKSAKNLFGSLGIPDLKAFDNPKVWKVAITLALIASIETLLSLDASDKLDPEKRKSPPDRELFAQGTGNFIAAFLGALPLTSVIVRSSANINAGAKTKLSCILNGFWLLVALTLLTGLLNKIPLATLAALLIVVGYQLVHPRLIKASYNEGWSYFLPFLITIVMVLVTDLLVGILIGLALHYAIQTYLKRKN